MYENLDNYRKAKTPVFLPEKKKLISLIKSFSLTYLSQDNGSPSNYSEDHFVRNVVGKFLKQKLFFRGRIYF